MMNLSDDELDDLFRKSVQQSSTDEDAEPEWDALLLKLKQRGNAMEPKFRSRGIVLCVIMSLTFLSGNHRSALIQIASADASGKQHIVHETVTLPLIHQQQLTEREVCPSIKRKEIHRETEIKKEQVVTNKIHDSYGTTLQAKVQPLNLPDSAQQVITIEPISKHDSTDEVVIGQQASEKIFKRGLSVKAMISPDISNVQSNAPGFGYNAGIMVEYAITNRFSLATGILRSKKNYTAENLEYRGYTADRVIGDCGMWDIPINVIYYFPAHKKSNWYLSTGVSSYLMSREKYDFQYKNSYGTRSYILAVDGKNHEIFKVINFSVGMQKQIRSNLFLQIEPFVKVPLEGIGEGKVLLSSGGAFFSLKYNLIP